MNTNNSHALFHTLQSTQHIIIRSCIRGARKWNRIRNGIMEHALSYILPRGHPKLTSDTSSTSTIETLSGSYRHSVKMGHHSIKANITPYHRSVAPAKKFSLSYGAPVPYVLCALCLKPHRCSEGTSVKTVQLKLWLV